MRQQPSHDDASETVVTVGGPSPDNLSPDGLQQLGRLDLVAKLVGDSVQQGLRQSCRRGFSTEFSDYKPYVPGDDPRFLDWHVYARTDRLLTKQFEAETSLESWLVLDATQSMAWRWRQTVTKLEYAVHLLAAAAYLHIRNQDRVGLVVHDGTALDALPPRSSTRQLFNLYERLSEFRPAGRALAELSEALSALRSHRGQILVCSDLEESPPVVLAALERLAAAEDDVILLHLLDRAEVEPPFHDCTHLRDSETGEEIEVDGAILRAEQREVVEAFRAKWSHECERLGILYRAVDTGMPYVDVLLSLVGR